MGIFGRPRIEFTDKEWLQIAEMVKIKATSQEISAIMLCSEDTLNRRMKEKFGMTFAEYFALVSPGGNISLRRKQWKLADKSASMAMFLGKNYLGQSDKQEMTHTQTEPFKLAYKIDD